MHLTSQSKSAPYCSEIADCTAAGFEEITGKNRCQCNQTTHFALEVSNLLTCVGTCPDDTITVGRECHRCEGFASSDNTCVAQCPMIAYTSKADTAAGKKICRVCTGSKVKQLNLAGDDYTCEDSCDITRGLILDTDSN